MLFGEELQGIHFAALKYVRAEHGEERMYDLDADPGERINVVAGAPALVEVGREALDSSAPRPRWAKDAVIRLDVPPASTALCGPGR